MKNYLITIKLRKIEQDGAQLINLYFELRCESFEAARQKTAKYATIAAAEENAEVIATKTEEGK